MIKRKIDKKNILHIVAIVLVIAFCVTSFAVALAFAAKEVKERGTQIFVATDTHIVANQVAEKDHTSMDKYATKEKLLYYGEGIFRTCIDELVQKGAKTLFVCGDITQFGDKASHIRAAEILHSAKERGITPFVINGNHDVQVHKNGNCVSQKEFKEIYNEFGYAQAIDTFPGTLSYVAEINDKLRLIAIDNIQYFRDDNTYKEKMDTEHKLWIYDCIDKCNKAGKQAIVIAHRPLMNHLPDIIEKFSNSDVDKLNKELLQYFAKHNVPTVVVGHMHFNDIQEKIFEEKDGEKKYKVNEILGCCLSMYDNSYREMWFGDKKTEVIFSEIKTVNPKYLPNFTSEEDKEKISTDLPALAKEHLYIYMDKMYKNLGNKGGILNIDSKIPEHLNKFLPLYKKGFLNAVEKCVTTPYYKSDEIEGGTSLERILESFGLEMPETEFKYFSDFANDVLFETLENSRDLTDEHFAELIKYTIFELVYFIDKAEPEINQELKTLGYKTIDKETNNKVDLAIDINVEKLFKEGKLECYDSNIMPMISHIGKDIVAEFSENSFIKNNQSLINNIISTIETNMSILVNAVVKQFLENYIEGYDVFINVDGGFIDLGGFLCDGVLKNYVSDFVMPSKYVGNHVIIDIVK